MGTETDEPWCAAHQTNHEYGVGCYFSHTEVPQPTGGVEDVAQAWIDKWVDPHLGFINWTNGHNSLTALLAVERTKSYEAGVRELLNNIKQLDTDWREYRGGETKAEFVLRRLAELLRGGAFTTNREFASAMGKIGGAKSRKRGRNQRTGS